MSDQLVIRNSEAEKDKEEIRVLIVEDHAPMVENISRMLQFEPDISVVGKALSGQEALELAEEVDPMVVLIDINLPDMDGIEVTGLLKEINFSIDVIILSIRQDFDVITRAMNKGASHFLLKPPDGEKLVVAVRDGYKRYKARKAATGPLGTEPTYSPDQPIGKVISIYSGKGGVGCTLMATNLALMLHSENTPTLLVDADLQFGDVPLFLNLNNRFSICDLVSYAEELDLEVLDDVLVPHESGLEVLAAPPAPEYVGEISSEALCDVLEFLQKQFAYVVLDTGSALDDVTLAILQMSDLIVAVVTPDIPAIKNTRTLLTILRDLGIPQEAVCFVLNSVDRRDKINAESVSEHLKVGIAAEVPFDRQSVKQSINRGVPIVSDGKTHPMIKGIHELVGVIREKLLVPVEN
jgi:pilus assembly protein CpaE